MHIYSYFIVLYFILYVEESTYANEGMSDIGEHEVLMFSILDSVNTRAHIITSLNILDVVCVTHDNTCG